MSAEAAIGCLLRGEVDAADEMLKLGAAACGDLLGYLKELLVANDVTLDALRPVCNPMAGVEAFLHTQGEIEMIYAAYLVSPVYMISFQILYAGRKRDRTVNVDVLAEQRLRLFVG